MPHSFRFPGVIAAMFKTYIQVVGGDRAMSFSTIWEADAAVATYALWQTCVDDYASAINPLLQPLFADQVKVELSLGLYRSDLADFDAADTIGSVVGTAAVIILEGAGSRELPSQDAYVIQRRTAHLNRDAYGRIFIPGVWEDFNNNGRLTSAGGNALKDLANWMGADRVFGGTNFHARHWSRKTDSLLPVVKCRAMQDLYSRRDRMPPAPRLPVAG